MDMSKEQKTTQLQQKIIHLKSELDKYKALLASLGSQEEWERLHMEKFHGQRFALHPA
ncbi:hypothetical protein LG52_1275 [Geobacillus kaustophilus]|uniref:Uncharacterized protein n=2 Tax=Geobacillus kaustophilus TaxID=1462 RepID=A0A0D8BYI7_GEOKU|nr:hypothetical protein LG52_1275 [Geobacillus kaustophilus]